MTRSEIDHFREVRNLLGGSFFECTSDNRCGDSDFWSGSDLRRGPGDKIDYDFTNTVDWVGGFAQGEIFRGPFSGFGMFGVSTIKYSYTNHFVQDPATRGKLQPETDNIWGFQVKGGGRMTVSRRWSTTTSTWRT